MVNPLGSSSCSSSGSIELIISSCPAISHIKLKAKGPLRTYGMSSNRIWALGHNLRDWGPYSWQALVAWSSKWKNLIGLSTSGDCARTLTSNIPLHLISGLSSKHFRPLGPGPSSGSGLTIAILSRRSRSLLFSSSLRQFEIFLLSKIRAAVRGTLFWKNDRSRTRMARLTGGRNMSSAKGGASLVCYALSTSAQDSQMGTYIHLDSTNRTEYSHVPPLLGLSATGHRQYKRALNL